jgi:hypothetical protein
MDDGRRLICVFVGSKVDVEYYKERLEENGILSMTKDNFRSKTIAGIGAVPNSIELLVEELNVEKALECIKSLQA